MKESLSQDDKSELIDLLKKLVAIPSVNAGECTGGVPEEAVGVFIAGFLENLGMEVQYLRLPNGRPNILGRWPGGGGRKKLDLSAHMDTVNVEGMTIEPFFPKVESGRLFGRGACDTKGSIAVYLWLLKKLAPRRESLAYDVGFLATCDEENGCRGSTWLAENKRIEADYVIVGEPTGSQIAVAHRGSIVLEIETRGISAHGSVPDKGDNAIYRMVDVVQRIREEWLPALREPVHPVLGRSSAAVTLISGGVRYNIIPDACRITIDLRVLPGLTVESAVGDLNRLLSRLPGVRADIRCTCNQPPLCTDPASPFVQRLLAARAEVVGTAAPIGLPYFADSSQFARAGAECVLVGPGDIAHAHGAAEFVELDQLFQSAQILHRFLHG